MAASTYDEALRRLLVHEGGYTNHPADPGGPTNFGITIHDYRAYQKPDASADDVRRMALADAKAIYRAKYWDAMRCDALPAGLDYAAFDYGVNSGTARAAKVLHRILGLTDAGKVDDAVLAATAKTNAQDLIVKLCRERLAFLKSLRTWPTFGGGWARRVAEVEAAALHLAATLTPAPGKAKEDDRVKRPAAPGSPPRMSPLAPSHVDAGGSLVAALVAAWQAAAHAAPFIVTAAIVVVGIGLAASFLSQAKKGA